MLKKDAMIHIKVKLQSHKITSLKNALMLRLKFLSMSNSFKNQSLST